MIEQSTREAILVLHQRGHSKHSIANALNISRNSVKKVLKSNTAEVPLLQRACKADEHHDLIVELHKDCKGNLVRVHEELQAQGVLFSYPALTAYCRRAAIGYRHKEPSGSYVFEPGQEIQHDTSPHRVSIRGKLHKAQTASAVLCFSRKFFIQLYPRFTRFECKIFLTDAFGYFGGSARVIMVDNTNVVVLYGTGKQMVAVPEMVSFAERYGARFEAHEKGDANRSARVELSFNYVENNFLAGRDFDDWQHVNREALLWCDKANGKYSNKLRASRQQLFVMEQPHLKPLPIWIPEVYQLHHRIVDVEGYVTVHGMRYSAPYQLIGRRLEVRETKNNIELYDGPRKIAVHQRQSDLPTRRIMLPEHRPPRGQGIKSKQNQRSPEELKLISAAPQLNDYIREMKKRCRGRATLPMRRLMKMMNDYPRDSFLGAIADATHYGLYDLERLERMVLRNVARDFFPPPELEQWQSESDKTDKDDDDE